MIEKITLDNALGVVLNQLDTAVDGAYAYGENTSGKQLRIQQAVYVNLDKGSELDTGINRGVLFVHYASGGNAALYLIDSFGTILINGLAEIFRTSDQGSGVCVYKEGVGSTIKIKQYMLDLASITYKIL